MWIIPPLICAIGIVVALLPPAEPINNPPAERTSTWFPRALTAIATLAVIAIALNVLLAA